MTVSNTIYYKKLKLLIIERYVIILIYHLKKN